MKLIDAEAMYERFVKKRDDLDGIYDATDLPDMLGDMPTIEAIPIEWIEEKIKHMKQDCESDVREVIQSLVYWWRAEQKGWR